MGNRDICCVIAGEHLKELIVDGINRKRLEYLLTIASGDGFNLF